jgi:VWFA-related protein
MKIRAVFLLHWSLLFAFNSIQAEQKQDQPYKIQVAVEEVRIDAVVLDRRGRQITDLTVKDFEVFQDGAKQEVLSSIYVADQTKSFVQPRIPASGELNKKSVQLPPIPTQTPARTEVRRTIVFIIDDIAMSYEQIRYARMSLINFVEKQMQPGDMVAVLRTGSGNSAIQMFLSDRRELLARINAAARWSSNGGRDLAEDNLFYIFDGQVYALNYCVRALEKMPGRKAIVLMTPQIVLPDYTAQGGRNYREIYLPKMIRISDSALRSGVVIHFMDIKMLDYEPPVRQANTFEATPVSGTMAVFQSPRAGDTMQLQNPLPKRTGGLLVENHNFALTGIGEVNDALKGYYLISYIPPAGTFINTKKEGYRRIQVRAKRGNVHTRHGFFSAQQDAHEPVQETNPLREALFNPFFNHDLSINLSSGYLSDAKEGYLIRSWVQLDPKNIEIIKKEDGHFVSLETISLIFNAEGNIQDSSLMKYDIGVKEENIPWIREHGLRFSLLIPVKKPGDYYVRVGIKDLTSGKVGSAYEFICIPDLSNGRLAISNMFVVNNMKAVSWILSGTGKDGFQHFLTPNAARDETKNPALRSYKPGENFEYMAVLYNANKKSSMPDLESQFILYRNGTERLRGEPQKIELDGIVDLSRIPIRKKMLLGNSLEQGDYILQLLVTDKNHKKQKPVAQTLSFQIEPK